MDCNATITWGTLVRCTRTDVHDGARNRDWRQAHSAPHPEQASNTIEWADHADGATPHMPETCPAKYGPIPGGDTQFGCSREPGHHGKHRHGDSVWSADDDGNITVEFDEPAWRDYAGAPVEPPPAPLPRQFCESTVIVTIDGRDHRPATWKCGRRSGHEGQHTDKAGRTWGPIPLCHEAWITGPGHTPMECTDDLGHNGPHRCGDVKWRYADMCGVTYDPTGAVCTREPGHDGGHDNGVTHWMDPADKARTEATWKQITENPELLPCGHVLTKLGATSPDEHACTRALGHDGLHADNRHRWGYTTNPTVSGYPTCGARWMLGISEVICCEPHRHWGPHRDRDLTWTFTRHAAGGPCNATSPDPTADATVTCIRTDPHSGVFDDRDEHAHMGHAANTARLLWVDESEDATPHDPTRDAACSTPDAPAAERDAADSTPHDAEQPPIVTDIDRLIDQLNRGIVTARELRRRMLADAQFASESTPAPDRLHWVQPHGQPIIEQRGGAT